MTLDRTHASTCYLPIRISLRILTPCKLRWDTFEIPLPPDRIPIMKCKTSRRASRKSVIKRSVRKPQSTPPTGVKSQDADPGEPTVNPDGARSDRQVPTLPRPGPGVDHHNRVFNIE